MYFITILKFVETCSVSVCSLFVNVSYTLEITHFLHIIYIHWVNFVNYAIPKICTFNNFFSSFISITVISVVKCSPTFADFVYFSLWFWWCRTTFRPCYLMHTYLKLLYFTDKFNLFSKVPSIYSSLLFLFHRQFTNQRSFLSIMFPGEKS